MFKTFRGDVLAVAVVVAIIYVASMTAGQWYFSLADKAEAQNINVLGDSIGGLTAPLALIFLIAAVIVQRQELALTKAELAKTADAMKKQAETAVEQAESARLQSQAAREQILLQREIANANYKVSLLDERFRIYSDIKDNYRRIAAMTQAEMDALATTFSKAQLVYGEDIALAVKPALEWTIAFMVEHSVFERYHGDHAFLHYSERLEKDHWMGSPIEGDDLDAFIEELKNMHSIAENVVSAVVDNHVLDMMREAMTIKEDLNVIGSE